jgi:superfamily I DNA and/or RNA helicase
MFEGEEPRTNPRSTVTPFRQTLNEPQLDAIAMALAAKDVCLIHGPPGTGKTTTVVELIRQAVARGDRVLAVAPSNVAVDNMVERLAVKLPGSAPRVLRVGHPARMTPTVLQHCMDAKIRVSTAVATVPAVTSTTVDAVGVTTAGVSDGAALCMWLLLSL